jgi:CDP-2,3-bis-(O-geranylgeranyl)-sn-glycerol synthase
MNLLTALWFFLPAGLANAGPVFANRIPGLNRWKTPMDFGKTYRGQRIFGANKTVRGLVVGIVLATLMIALQKHLFTRNLWVLEHSALDYRAASVWLLGPLFGAGALIGDAVESFFKRRRGILPGHTWFPFDQLDYIIGGLLFVAPIAKPSLGLVIAVMGVYFTLHLITVYVGYRTGFRDKPI